MRNKLAFIGAGNMGCAIANGILLSDMMEPSQLTLVRRNIEKLAEFKERGCGVSDDVIGACRASDAIILGVKPQMFGEIMPLIAPYVEGKLVIGHYLDLGKCGPYLASRRLGYQVNSYVGRQYRLVKLNCYRIALCL